jgi:hypothetical protein
MTKQLGFALHDPLHCAAPGLFRTMTDGERKRQKLDVRHEFGKETARFIGFEPLDGFDARILVGLVALAGREGKMLRHDHADTARKRMRELLDPRLDAEKQDALLIQTTRRALLREVGRDPGGKTMHALDASLTRMANVTVIVERGARRATFHLLGWAVDEGDDTLLVALNPRITEAILGERPWTRISLDEVRALESERSVVVHQRLCSYVDPGKPARVGIDTLCSYLGPGAESGGALRMRRARVRAALAELRGLGWVVSEDGEHVTITRSRREARRCGKAVTLVRESGDAGAGKR